MSVVFHHVPKTAGTSLIALLKQQFSFARVCPDRALPVNRFVRPSDPLLKRLGPEISRYGLFCGHYYFDLTCLVPGRPMARVIFFREPADRLISYYFHRYHTRDVTIDRAFRAGEISAERAAFIREVRRMTLRDYLGRDGSGPAQDPLTDLQARIAAAALGQTGIKEPESTAREFDTIGITEWFEPSLQLMCFERGFKYPGRTLALNERASPGCYDRADTRAMRTIDRMTQKDRALYTAAKAEFLERYRRMIRAIFEGSGVHAKRIDHVLGLPFSVDGRSMIAAALDAYYRRNAPEYFKAFPRLVIPRGGSMRLNMSDAICGSGWLARDGEDVGDPEGMSRWSGPGTVSELDFLVGPGAPLVMTADIAGEIEEGILKKTSVLANGRPLEPAVEEKNGNGALLRCRIPGGCAEPNGLLSLRFVTPRTVSHHELNGADDRRPKGFRLSSVTIEPAAA